MTNNYVDEYIHGAHVQSLSDGTDAVVVKVHRHKDNEITNELVVIQQPERAFYVTKPALQTHALKKEREALKNLDLYRVPNYRMVEELNRVLNGRSGGWKRPRLRNLCDSPYVYGADIHIETLIKRKYQKAFERSQRKPTVITTGFLDIETDVVTGAGHEPTMITVTHENKVYTAIQRRFFTVKNKDGTFSPGNLDDFVDFSKKTLDHHIEELLNDYTKKNPKSKLKQLAASHPFEYYCYVGDSASDIIRWIFMRIHENKTDFVGVWNIDFDISKILLTLERENVRITDIFCPPELPEKYRYAEYKPDTKDVDSIYKKWHWMHATSYSQFIDSMCLYSILRIVKGKEISYSLDSILKINDLGGKLTFKDDDPATEDLAAMDWHRYMQKNESYKYIVYNQFDCISLQLMEWKNMDLSSMLVLGGVSQLSKWSRQTRKVADALYFDALDDNHVMASPGTTMETEFDKMLTNTGGAVLRPERTTGIGLKIFSDIPNLVTMLHNFVGDVDFSSMYPTATEVCNVSKETKLSTSLNIEGRNQLATQAYYSQAISLDENAVFIGREYFNLPGYDEMAQRLKAHLLEAA